MAVVGNGDLGIIRARQVRPDGGEMKREAGVNPAQGRCCVRPDC